MPSFQSPLPMSGMPCTPAVSERSIARQQCSYTLPVVPESAGIMNSSSSSPSSCGPVTNGAVASSTDAVAGARDVERGDVRQPEQVVGEARADALARGRMPPVHHVALDELVRCVQNDLRARERRIEIEQCGRVLQLIAKAERAARLIVRRPSPTLGTPDSDRRASHSPSGRARATASRSARRRASPARTRGPRRATALIARNFPYARSSARARSSFSASPSRNAISTEPPAGIVSVVANAAHGSSPAPTRPSSGASE